MKTKTSITLSRENLKEILTEAVSALVPGFALEKFSVHQNGSIDVTLVPADQMRLPSFTTPELPAEAWRQTGAELPLDKMPVRDDPPVNPLLDGKPQ